jgi:hypothetical protein
VLQRFSDLRDPDEKRREILWMAILFIVIFACWLFVALLFGLQPLLLSPSWQEVALSLGLGILLLCTICYLALRERELRSSNKRLVEKLTGAVQALSTKIAQLDGLCATSGEFAGSLDARRVAALAVEALAERVGASEAVILLLDREGKQPLYCHEVGASGLSPERVAWLASRRERLLLLSQEQARPFLSQERPGEGGERSPGGACVIGAPILLSGQFAGCLGAYRLPGAQPFTPEDLSLLTTLANMASKAIESAQLHEELQENYLSTVRSLTRSLGARDNYTAAHGNRVASLACRLAQQLGLPEHQVEAIASFAPLHDLGKIGVPDGVLLKPDRLTPEEQAACEQHPVMGERILRPLRPGIEVLSMIRHHHERWDGGGYPDGLRGEQIPLLARLLKVADVFDALLVDRPYGPAMKEQEALAEMQVAAGLEFDPCIVRALGDVIGGRAPASSPTLSPSEPVAAASHGPN